MADDLRLRLTIKPDPDEIGWTHLHGPNGTTVTLHDLPPPLRGMISGFIFTLCDRGVTRFEFDGNGVVRIITAEGEQDLGLLLGTRSRSNVRRGLLLTAWWIEFQRMRKVGLARMRLGIQGENAMWWCLECRTLVAPTRGFCQTVNCPSWDKLHQCTGEPILRAMARTA